MKLPGEQGLLALPGGGQGALKRVNRGVAQRTLELLWRDSVTTGAGGFVGFALQQCRVLASQGEVVQAVDRTFARLRDRQ